MKSVLVEQITTERATRKVPIRTSCQALGVSESWYYKHRARPVSDRDRRREALTEAIWGFYQASGYTYGSPRITLDLWEAGWQVSVNTVADIMAEHGWAGRERPRRRNLTPQGKRRAALGRGSRPRRSSTEQRRTPPPSAGRWHARAIPPSEVDPPFDQFLIAADAVARARPEVDPMLAREVFLEAATLLNNGLALDGLGAEDARAVVAGLCADLVTDDPGAAVRAQAGAALRSPGDLRDPQGVSAAYLSAAAILQL